MKRSQPTFADEKIPPDTFANLSVPLDIREFEVVSADDNRGVFVKLSRLPDDVQFHDESHPARIVLDIKGPTGEESPEEVFPGKDALVSRIRVTRTPGNLQVVLELDSDVAPEYTVHPLADWIMVRFSPDA